MYRKETNVFRLILAYIAHVELLILCHGWVVTAVAKCCAADQRMWRVSSLFNAISMLYKYFSVGLHLFVLFNFGLGGIPFPPHPVSTELVYYNILLGPVYKGLSYRCETAAYLVSSA